MPIHMKASYVAGLVIAAVLITLVIEESRIHSLRQTEKTAVEIAAKSSSAPIMEESAAAIRTKSRTEPAPDPAPAAKEPASTEESFMKTARKMWENPAGKSMMNQGAKMAVGMLYQDFVDGLQLSKEEGEYFKNLLGKEISDQQELGMKMLGATAEEQKSLAEELLKRNNETQDEIKKFLNNDEDYKAFTDYKNHLPEHQQLDGIRSAMSAKAVPLDSETESKLVEAMYRSRTESKAPDFSGPNAMSEMTKGNLVKNYEKSWAIQQEALRAETGKILNEAQMSAFQEFQKQAKEMQLMGLKMAEQMMGGKKDAAD